MSRGFVVGLLWGVVVSAAGLVIVSLVAPPLQTEIAQGEAAAEGAADGATEGATEEVAKDTAAEDPAEPLAEPKAEPVAAVAEPSVGTVSLDPAPSQPEDPAQAGDSTPPADPAAPAQDTAEETAAPAGANPQPAPEVDATAAEAITTSESSESVEIATAEDAAPTLPEGEPAPVLAPTTDSAPAPDSGTMPAPKQDKLLDPPALTETPVVEASPELPEGEASDEVALPQVPAEPAAPEVAPESAPDPQVNPPPAADDSGSKLAPDAALEKDAAGVVSNRLPRIGDTEAGASDPAAEEDPLALDPDNALPIRAHAREFSAEEGKPRFAILLLDIGAQGMAREDLVKLPFALTFVVDPTSPDAAEAAAAYRAAGQEVMILAKGLPEGATAADLEQSFQALAAELPQTVAMLDAATGGLQENRPLATQAIPILKSQGRGIVTYDRGLGAADQVAAREALPHATIFRELDAEGEDTPLIRRYLDRAAFKAAQENAVVVIGQSRPETVAAILEWMIEGRGASVQLAPITAVMQDK